MLNKFESDMPAFPNKQFPAGDVLPRSTEKARQLFETLRTGDRQEQQKQIQMMRHVEIPTWEYMLSQTKNNSGLKYLCDAWGNTLSDPQVGSALVRIGLYSSLAFIQRSHLLPTKFSDFNEELFIMSSHDTATIQMFANQAWAGMERTHPEVHGVMHPFVDHLLAINDISPNHEDETSLIRAGAALPYLLASTTRADTYLQNELRPDGLWLKVISEIDKICTT